MIDLVKSRGILDLNRRFSLGMHTEAMAKDGGLCKPASNQIKPALGKAAANEGGPPFWILKNLAGFAALAGIWRFFMAAFNKEKAPALS